MFITYTVKCSKQNVMLKNEQILTFQLSVYSNIKITQMTILEG